MLEIRPDKTFKEHILYSPGNTVDLSGKWFWGANRLNLDSLWIPKDFAPESIVVADKYSAEGQTKFTDRGFWSLPVERDFGATSLVVFPDEGVNFRMESRL